jgi:F0F1-type ATP synthase membrane subunit b/b'
MGSESELLPNATLFVQLGLFLICYFMLKTFVFGPYLRLLELRREKTSGLKEKAASDSIRAEKLKGDYDAFMKTERRKLSGWLDDERKKVSEEARSIIQGAREGVAVELKGRRAQIQKEAEEARKQLAPLVGEYSSLIATKVVGRKIKVSAQAAELSAAELLAEQTV